MSVVFLRVLTPEDNEEIIFFPQTGERKKERVSDS